MGHHAVREATDIFLNDRPTEGFCARAKATATQDNDPATECESEGDGEDSDEDREMAGTRPELINLDDIPEIVDQEAEAEAELESESESEESDAECSDDEAGF